jgi:hypothetical protein
MEPVDTLLLGQVVTGVWGCASLPHDVGAHVDAFGWSPVVISGPIDKPGLLAAFATAARFPSWVGRNWDALDDALRDLSWLPAGDVLVVVDDPEGRLDPAAAATLADILDGASRFWARRRRRFAAIWSGSPRFLPDLETLTPGTRAQPLQN